MIEESTGSVVCGTLPFTDSDRLDFAGQNLPPAECESTTAADGSVCPCPFWKRTIDVAGAIAGLVLLSPLFAAIALWIKLVSPGPVFFRHRRYGLAGRPFRVWKFRSLKMNEPDSTQRDYMVELMESEQPMVKRDPHLAIIPGGRIMRQLGIDELPQLINILQGEMSFVGPRPHVVPLQSYAIWQRPRFDVVPGITGLWQISDKEQTTFSTMMQMDIEYIGRRTLWLDLKILFGTFPAVVRSALSSRKQGE